MPPNNTPIVPNELGPEFDLGLILPNKYSVKRAAAGQSGIVAITPAAAYPSTADNTAVTPAYVEAALNDRFVNFKPPFEVQRAYFHEVRNDPIGTPYSAFLAAMPVHTIVLTNPFTDRPARLIISGSLMTQAGWGGANLSADTRAMVNGAIVAITNQQGDGNSATNGYGMLNFDYTAGDIPPGGSFTANMQLSGAVTIDAGATRVVQDVHHDYEIRWYAFTL